MIYLPVLVIILLQDRIMMLNSEFTVFVARWLARANKIQLDSLDNYFDKFFTLFVVYNRLYVEAAFSKPHVGSKSFSDGKAATSWLVQFLGADKIISAINTDRQCVVALEQIATLIEQEKFAIKLHRRTRQCQPSEDKRLLQRLRDPNGDIKAEAILDLIYSVRCNTFHGQKGFEDVQKEILGPVIVLLEKIIELLREQPANTRLL